MFFIYIVCIFSLLFVKNYEVSNNVCEMGNINVKNYEVSNGVCKCIIYRKVCREILSFGNLSGSMQPTKKDHTLVAETAYPS